MRIQSLAAVVALFLLAPSADANEGNGFGVCHTGYVDGTHVTTESRGEITIAQVQVNDRIWSFNGFVDKQGWSKVLKRVDGGQSYKLLVDFTEQGTNLVTKGCFLIKRAS